nr:hypothetical protein [Micromonospora sp. DSM 115978]
MTPLAEHPLGPRRQRLGKIRQDPGRDVDENQPDLFTVQAGKRVEGTGGEPTELGCDLRAGVPGPDHHEGQVRPPCLRVRAGVGVLELTKYVVTQVHRLGKVLHAQGVFGHPR